MHEAGTADGVDDHLLGFAGKQAKSTCQSSATRLASEIARIQERRRNRICSQFISVGLHSIFEEAVTNGIQMSRGHVQTCLDPYPRQSENKVGQQNDQTFCRSEMGRGQPKHGVKFPALKFQVLHCLPLATTVAVSGSIIDLIRHHISPDWFFAEN